MSEAQAAQRDDSPMDVDQPSPLEQDPAPLGMIHLQIVQTTNDKLNTCGVAVFSSVNVLHVQ